MRGEWKKEYCDNKRQVYLIFAATFIWGIMAHAFIMFNKIALHDESLELYGQDLNTISQGRWMQELIRRIEIILFGESRLSTTFIYVIYAFAVCSLLSCLLNNYFNIKGTIKLVAMSGIIVTSPTLLMSFGYSYFLPYYLTGFLLVVVSIYFSVKDKSITSTIFAIIFMCLAMGVYQGWMTFGLSMIYLAFFNEVENNEYRLKIFLKNGIHYLCIPVFASIGYFFINNAVLTITNTRMTSYAGLDTMGVTDFAGYIGRIKSAYFWFFCPPSNEMSTFFPLTSNIVYKIILMLALLLFSLKVIESFRKEKRVRYQEIVLFFLFPIVLFALLIIGGPDNITPLNQFSYISLFVFFLQRCEDDKNMNNVIKFAQVSLLVLVFALAIFYVRFDNSNYIKAEAVQNEMREWFTRLAARIQTVEGYDDEIPILYINEFEKKDGALTSNQAYHMTSVMPYALNEDYLLNDFAWRAFMKNHCGFNPWVITLEDIIVSDEDMGIIENMPSYPDYGSIRRMNNYIVVKF